MDLKRYEEAKLSFASDLMKAVLAARQLPVADTFEYHFAFGNTLGALGDARGMEKQLSRALQIAAIEMGDAEYCRRAWFSLARLATHLNEWDRLMQITLEMEAFAQNTQNLTIWHGAMEVRARAFKEMGDYENARELGEKLLDFCRTRNLGEGMETWEKFLASLPKA